MPKRHRNPNNSDYLRETVDGGPVTGPTADPNDTVMAPKSNPVSDGINWLVTEGMDLLGYDTRARPAAEDNDFYRNYAQYMPGYDIDGIPSGAWAQNAATNHVGHGTGPGNPWDNVRRSLVDQESSMIESRLAAGGSGDLSFWDVYDAHVNAYATSGGGGNQFIDPASFALAVYGAPLLEAAGIDSGPITGASIDLFNDPTDSATEGWLKRMGLAGAEIAGGGAMMGAGLATANPLLMLGGAATTGIGLFGAAWNTGSAIAGGMLGEWGSAIADGAGAVGGAIADGAGALWDGAGSAVSGVGDFVGGLFSW